MDLPYEEYVKDPRISCTNGWNCNQKSRGHHSKYKHPPKKRSDNVTGNRNKKPKIDDECTNSSSSDDFLPVTVDKPETISESASETNEDETVESMETIETTGTNERQENKRIPKDFDRKEFIKSKFLVEMPDDFYKFWDFCKTLKPNNPLLAFKEVDMSLVGPFDVLGGKFDDTLEQKMEKYLVHWRFYYDPPEFQTVLVGKNFGYHVGYFRDEPTKLPVFLAENYADENGMFSVVADNIFAIVYSYLNGLSKSANKSRSRRMSIRRLLPLVKLEAEKLNFDLSKKSSITERNSRIVAWSFNTLGMVMPSDEKSPVGYRPLSMSHNELKGLLDRLLNATGSERDRWMSMLQFVLTNASIATDECDFMTGLELGLDMLYSGVDYLNSLTKKYLCNAYNLLNMPEFAQIAQAHMDNRRKGNDLGIV